MTIKKSFLLHIDSLDVLDHLTNEQCGELLKAFKAYHYGEELDLSPVLSISRPNQRAAVSSLFKRKRT